MEKQETKECDSGTKHLGPELTAKAQKSETVHGTVYYTVVTCDSCGVEVKRDDAYVFIIGDLHEDSDWSSNLSLSFNTDDDVRVGWACEHCAETNPVSFPERQWRKHPDMLMVILTVIAWLLLLGLTAVSVI